ncbi:MAG: Lrp/AsnC ligand binding domain-containing protein [Candidatus Bathyarchaeia archaeon]
MKAYLLLRTKPGTSDRVIKDIKEQVKGVIQADSVYGRFDAIALIEAPDLRTINEIVYNVIEANPNIIHTETSIALSEK